MKDITLDVQQFTINVSSPNFILMDLALPKKVKFQEGKAQFDKNTFVLSVILPLDPEDIPL